MKALLAARSSQRIWIWASLAVLTLVIMECTEASLWYQAVFTLGSAAWSAVFAILFTIVVASYALARAMERLRWRMLAGRGAILAWVILVFYSTLKIFIYPHTDLPLAGFLALPARFFLHPDEDQASFFHLIAMILLVWRGVALARSPLSHFRVQASFQLGVLVILFYGLIFAPLHPLEATAGLYLFLFCGLVAMSTSRIATLSEGRGGRVPRFGLRWLFSILGAGLAVVAMAVLAGWISSGRVVEILTYAVIALFALLTAILFVALSPFLGLLAQILSKASDLIQQLMDRIRSIASSQQIELLIHAINNTLDRIFPFVMAGRGIFLLGIVILVVLGVLLALRRRSTGQALEEEVSENSQPGAAENTLQRLLNRLLQNAHSLRLRGPAQALAAARIRQIYRLLMEQCQKLGVPRPASATPLEFLPKLEVLLPDEQAGLELLTTAYLKVRYGEYPEARQEVEAVEQAWRQIRRRARNTLAARKRGK